MSDTGKPILLLDFDGVISNNDAPVDGFFEWAIDAYKQFSLNIYSRVETQEKKDEMQLWLQTHLIAWRHHQMERNSSIATAELSFNFPDEMPFEALAIEANSISFNGKWSDPKFRPDRLLQFHPWNSPDYVPNPEDEPPPPNVVAPNITNICPRHPWMTMQEPSGRRHCTATGCTWTG
jgi:hypothetical protein